MPRLFFVPSPDALSLSIEQKLGVTGHVFTEKFEDYSISSIFLTNAKEIINFIKSNPDKNFERIFEAWNMFSNFETRHYMLRLFLSALLEPPVKVGKNAYADITKFIQTKVFFGINDGYGDGQRVTASICNIIFEREFLYNIPAKEAENTLFLLEEEDSPEGYEHCRFYHMILPYGETSELN